MEPAIAVVVGFVASYALTPIAGRAARRFGILDVPDTARGARKTHDHATPYLGGLAIFLGLAAGAVFLLIVGPTQIVLASRQLVLGIALAGTVGLVGLIDDIKPLPQVIRLAIQIGAALAAWTIGFKVEATQWPILDFLLTLFWIVGITNAFNLLDNMDGLSSGLAGIAASAFAIMGALEGLTLIPIVAGALAGASFGFLAHNRYPARIFMGDAGSLFIGFMLAMLGLGLRFDNLVEVTFLVPVVVLGVPIFDTTLVVLSRIRARRPIWQGARDHVSHRLIAIGLPVKETVLLLYWTAICLGWLGLVISRSDPVTGWMLLAFVFALGLFFGRLMWKVPIASETTLANRETTFDDAEEGRGGEKVAG